MIRLSRMIGARAAYWAASGILKDPREADKREWEVASGISFEEAVYDSFHSPYPSWIAHYGADKVLCVFGVCPSGLNPRIGNAWLAATNEAVKYVHRLHRHFEEGLVQMLDVYPTLHAWADERNVLHGKWMLKMGFERTESLLHFGEPSVPFRLFTITKEMHDRCASQAQQP